MNNRKDMADFDWVTALFSCSPNKVFETLKLQIEKDVKIRNGLLSPQSSYAFSVSNYQDNFTVLVESSTDHRSVTFTLTEKGIAVRDGKGKLILEAFLTINDEGECRPKINGKECEFWQFRKMALEDLFIL